MKPLSKLLLLTLLACAAWAQPSIISVENSASQLPGQLPNGGVAQGALFILRGANMGPANIVIATAFPLTTTLGGTSIRVSVGGTTADAIMYYTVAHQVAAVLPSRIPVGTGTVTVTYNGQTSATFPITVVASAFGTFTNPANGQGDAIAFINGATLVTPTNAANPNDVVVFWGTGLRRVDFDEANPAQQFDMTDVPIEAYVGGVQAAILFRGRNSCCTAVDTVYIRIPAGVAGCAVPVVFKIGNIVSNTSTIAVATTGRTCTPTSSTITTDELGTLISRGSYSFGVVSLLRSVSVTQPLTFMGIPIQPGGTQRDDSGSASFSRITIPAGGAGLGGQFDIISFGACSIFIFDSVRPIGGGGSFTSLDAGAQITVNGPQGNKVLAKQSGQGFIGYFNQFDETGTYLAAGSYTVAGPGGPDVGAFSTNTNAPNPLVWTNQQTSLEVTRANGYRVNWTGGDPSGYVQITGSSAVLIGQRVISASFTCNERTSVGTFLIPAIVLLALPPSGVQNVGGFEFPSFGSLSVDSYSSKRFTAPGVDYSLLQFGYSNSNQVTYR